MAKKKKTRKRYTEKQRSSILTTAAKEGLTAAGIQKRFGVAPVTYYSWRKKAGVGKGRSRAAARARNGALGIRVRGEVQARMRSLLPKLVEAEVKRYLDVALGSGGRRRG
jgi:transposase-like protein